MLQSLLYDGTDAYRQGPANLYLQGPLHTWVIQATAGKIQG